MSYCKIHGEYYGYVCDGCQDAEWKQSNPGDYQCPHCKYISLKNEASRCPLCHGGIESDYWNNVRAAEKSIEEARAAEERRTAPARAAAAIEADRSQQNRRIAHALLFGGPMWALLGAFVGVFVGACRVLGSNLPEPWSVFGMTVLICALVGYAIGALLGYHGLMD